MTQRRTSMNDVARQAGVSYQTVSRVLNSPHLVHPRTRARVEHAISDLKYTRNLAARALRTTQSSIIGVITDGSSFFGPAATLSAVEQAANRAGFATLLTSVMAKADARTQRIRLNELGVDGIVIIAPHEEMTDAISSDSYEVPTIAITSEAQFPAPRLHYLGLNQFVGARLATCHLIQCGASRILHLQGPATWFDARERLKGFQHATEERQGITRIISPALSWEADSAYRYVSALSVTDIPEAIFAANDHLALGALKALREKGARVPEDVLVVGFDDIAGAEYFAPSLTTIRQPFSDLGTKAVEALVALLQGAPLESKPQLEPELIVRGSTSISTQG